MRFLKLINMTIRMWFEMRECGYSFKDCWELSADILDKTDYYLQFKD